MANNRMWLKCECGEQFYLAKYYPTITSGWYTSLPTKAMAGEFSAETVHLEYAQEALTWFAKFQHEMAMLPKPRMMSSVAMPSTQRRSSVTFK